MRVFHRALATALAGLALTAGLAPASATPEDGEGCAGSPSLPDTYVCVISVTPENVVPTTTVGSIDVTVPKLCYVAGCAEPRTVEVPVPGVTPKTGVVATLWYKGAYIPIAVGTADALALVYDTIDLANGVADDAMGTVAYAAELANGAAATAIGIVNDAADGAVEDVNRRLEDAQEDAEVLVQNLGRAVQEYRELVYGYRDQVYEIRDNLVYEVEQTIQNLPTVQELRDTITRLIANLLDSPTVRKIMESINLPCTSCILDPK
jgi:vacuolar-type H+-ATPase subunit H